MTQEKYDNIIEEQVLISYMSNGGISIEDTDMISPYDRSMILKSIIKIKEQEREAQAKANSNHRVSRY